METRAIKWHIVNGGLNEKARLTTSPSHSYHSGNGGEDAVVESFVVNAPDGSKFLVQITKLKGEDPIG